MDHTLRNPVLKEWEGGGSHLWLRWNIGLFSWNVPKGILDSSLMTRSSVILHRHTHNIKQTGNASREGDRSVAPTAGLSLCSIGRWWVLSQECVEARSMLMPEHCSQVSQSP